MNGLSRHLRASSFPLLLRSYCGINSVSRFSSQSDGFSGRRFGEQGPVSGSSSGPNKTFSEMNSGLFNRGVNGSSVPNDPPTFKTAMKSRLPNTEGGSGFLPSSLSSHGNFPKSSLPKEKSNMDFLKEVLGKDDARRTSGLLSHFHRPNVETNADIIHIKMLRNNTFVTVTDSKGNVKCKATSGSLPDLKGGRKMTNYTADATAENIGRRAKAMGLKSVVVKVNGFTHFSKKKKAIIAFRDGFTNSRSDMNPIVYIEDTTRKAHNGCRLPRKRRT